MVSTRLASKVSVWWNRLYFETRFIHISKCLLFSSDLQNTVVVMFVFFYKYLYIFKACVHLTVVTQTMFYIRLYNNSICVTASHYQTLKPCQKCGYHFYPKPTTVFHFQILFREKRNFQDFILQLIFYWIWRDFQKSRESSPHGGMH